MFRILFNCGLRSAELRELCVGDVDIIENTLAIWDTKFHNNRVVPFSEPVADTLTKYLENLSPQSGNCLLFPSPKPHDNGGAYGASWLGAQFRMLLDHANIPYYGPGKGPRPHDTRHTFAVHCLNNWMISTPETATKRGRRNLVLLTILYDTPARVSELVNIRIRDERLEAPAVITLLGKGGKIRSVPLMKQTVELIRAYFVENRIDPHLHSDMPLFWNAHRQKLTRSGVTYILQKYVEMAQEISPVMPTNVTPHKLRHPNVKPTTKIFSTFLFHP